MKRKHSQSTRTLERRLAVAIAQTHKLEDLVAGMTMYAEFQDRILETANRFRVQRDAYRSVAQVYRAAYRKVSDRVKFADFMWQSEHEASNSSAVLLKYLWKHHNESRAKYEGGQMSLGAAARIFGRSVGWNFRQWRARGSLWRDRWSLI